MEIVTDSPGAMTIMMTGMVVEVFPAKATIS
jgi:hypothetical protein